MIDLKDVITKYPECLENSEKLKAYLTDLYPSEKAKVSIIVAIFNSGIADEIKKSSNIDEINITRYCNKLESDFGFSQKFSNECLNIWLTAYDKINNQSSNIETTPQVLDSLSKTLIGNHNDELISVENPLGSGKVSDVFAWKGIVAISAKSNHILGLKSDGTVLSAGCYSWEKCSHISNWNNIIKISAGITHSLGLKSDGTVVAAGDNKFGECDVSSWTDIIAISAHYFYSIGLKSNGTVLVAGKIGYDDCESNVSLWKDIVSVYATEHYPFGLKADGTVVVLDSEIITDEDDEFYYEFINGEYGDMLLSELENISAISAGDYNGSTYILGLKADGTVDSQGKNIYGRCDVSEWTDIIEISAGATHSLGLKSDGTVVVSGWTQYDACDVHSWTDIIAIQATEECSFGLKSDGTIVAVGDI